MPEYKLTLLHTSDLHDRGSKEKELWRRRRVLGTAWERNLEEIHQAGPIDLVCFTGDAVFSGNPDEYRYASDFFAAMLERLGLGWDRFFVVPGNHDITQGLAKAIWKRHRRDLSKANILSFSRWFADNASNGKPPLGFKSRDREAILSRQAAYRDWVTNQIGRSELAPEASPHGRLGYRSTIRLPGRPFDLHVIGLDSSWMCGDNNDSGKLWLTDEQVMRLATDVRGDPLPGFRLCLVHHPLDDLADGLGCRQLLAERVDLLLRGHLHEVDAQTWADPHRQLRQVVAGCLYHHDQYPNACERIQITLAEDGHPLRYELTFRSWARRGFWFNDNSIFAGTVDGRLIDWVSPPTPASHSDNRVARVFVGREQELLRMETTLCRENEVLLPCVLSGMPGAGKSYLADRFALTHAHYFHGGYFRLALNPLGSEPEALWNQLAVVLHVPSTSDGLPERIRARLLQPRSLLHIENIDSREQARATVALTERLMGCSVIITGRYQGLGASASWTQIEVSSYVDDATALCQLKEELGEHLFRMANEEECLALILRLGRLPLAIHLAAGYLRTGRSVDGFLTLLHATDFELAPADEADPTSLRERNRAILSTSFTISLDVLQDLIDDQGMMAFLTLRDAPVAGFGVEIGQTLTGLQPMAFEDLAIRARELSLLEWIPTANSGAMWRLHPLLRELLRVKSRQSQSILLPYGTGTTMFSGDRKNAEKGTEVSAITEPRNTITPKPPSTER